MPAKMRGDPVNMVKQLVASKLRRDAASEARRIERPTSESRASEGMEGAKLLSKGCLLQPVGVIRILRHVESNVEAGTHSRFQNCDFLLRNFEGKAMRHHVGKEAVKSFFGVPLPFSSIGHDLALALAWRRLL